MERLRKSLWWLITGLFMVTLVVQGQILGVLRAEPQAVRALHGTWNREFLFSICMICVTIVTFWLYLDYHRRAKPPSGH
jgi:hypothetical protein